MKQDVQKKFDDVRELFPHTRKIIYFNSASHGPFSTEVKKAIDDYTRMRVDADRDETADAFIKREELRADYASLIGAGKNQIGLGLNTSFGLNVAAYGLPLKKGDEILVSDVEFPAIVYTFRAAAEMKGLKIKFIKSTNRCFDIHEFEKAITKKTRVLALSFVQYFNGYKNDLAAIGEICRKHDIYFVVDGIQGMGTEPVNVRKLGLDMFSSGCQKWMLSPQGCGFFYISDRVRDQLSYPFMSWLGVDWQMDFTSLFKYDLPYFKSAVPYELGYYVVLNLLGMVTSVKVFKGLGIKNIQSHNYELIDRLADYLKSEPCYTITSALDKTHRSSIFTFRCDDGEELHRLLLKNKIVLVRREGSIRVSVHLFNNKQDIDRLITLLEGFARKKR